MALAKTGVKHMSPNPVNNQPSRAPSATILRKKANIKFDSPPKWGVRKVTPTAPQPFIREQPTMNTQWTFRVSKTIVVDNTKMPQNMDIVAMTMLQVQDE
jgi:hypothetical protein